MIEIIHMIMFISNVYFAQFSIHTVMILYLTKINLLAALWKLRQSVGSWRIKLGN